MATIVGSEAAPINLGTMYSYYYLRSTSYDYDDTRRMIKITYRDEGRTIGGTLDTVIRNLLPWWLGRGTCLPTNENLED